MSVCYSGLESNKSVCYSGQEIGKSVCLFVVQVRRVTSLSVCLLFRSGE